MKLCLTAMVIVFLCRLFDDRIGTSSKDKQGRNGFAYWYYLMGYVHVAAPFSSLRASAEEFSLFLESFPSLGSLTFKEQCTRFVVEHQVLDSIGEIAETLIFLIRAMITVELIDAHGGFMFITNHITTKKRRNCWR